MARTPVIAVGALAALLAACTGASAREPGPTSSLSPATSLPAPKQPPWRRCSQRIEVNRPVEFGRPGSTVVGPIDFESLDERARDPRLFERYWNERREEYGFKNAIAVRANRIVELRVAPESQDVADVEYGWRGRRFVADDAVRFKSCDRNTKAFSYNGKVGAATAFSGGFKLKQPACVTVEVRVRGSRRVFRKTLSFGMGDACEAGASAAARPRVFNATCDRAVGTFARRDASIGPLAAVRGVRGYADPVVAERFANNQGPGYGFKAPLAVRRGRAVTISVARSDRDFASIGLDGQSGFHTIHFPACPASGSSRYERNWASWVNGFRLKRLGCVHLVARERGSDEISRTTLSFGMGRGACDPPATAAAAPPTRRCSQRIELTGPVPFKNDRSTVLGPLAFQSIDSFRSASSIAPFYDEATKRYSIKNALTVRAGRVVELRIAARSARNADLKFARRGDTELATDNVFFKSCPADERAFSYDGTVGAATVFNGTFELKKPACVDVEARERGKRRVYRTTISLGAGRCR